MYKAYSGTEQTLCAASACRKSLSQQSRQGRLFRLKREKQQPRKIIGRKILIGFTDCEDCFTGLGFFSKACAIHFHAAAPFFRQRMCRHRPDIRLKALDEPLRFLRVFSICLMENLPNCFFVQPDTEAHDCYVRNCILFQVCKPELILISMVNLLPLSAVCSN